MADEPSLPSLPLLTRKAPFPEERQQKRVKLHSTPPVSSDPPFFSSDDDPSAENYSTTSGRHKKRFRGPWYSQQPEDKRTKREFQRQFDSGVWLGSDSTEDDEDATFTDQAQSSIAGKDRLPLFTRLTSVNGSKTNTMSKEPSAEELAEKEIGLCLETGNENIDLSYGRGH